jgi:hypothetical protein
MILWGDVTTDRRLLEPPRMSSGGTEPGVSVDAGIGSGKGLTPTQH